MTEVSHFWTTNDVGDGPSAGYSASVLFNVFRALFAKASNAGGVSPEFLNELAVSGASSPVAVATGAAVVYGIPYINDAQVNVTVPTPTTATRIDRIVLRASWSAQTVRVTRIAGTEGGAAPSLTQSAGTTWDIPLAQVSITTGGVITVTDERQWLDVTGDGAVTTAKLADDAVTQPKIGAGAVGTTELANDAVTTAKIATGAVGTTDIADDAVTNAKIGPGAVGTTELANDAVTTAKIAAGAVGTTDIADDAVTQPKIGPGAVGTTELADGGVTTAKLAAGALGQMLVIPLGYGQIPNDNTVYSEASETQYKLVFDASKIPSTATVKLRVVCSAPSGGTFYARLYNATNSAAITGSEVSTTNTAQNIQTSADFRANLPSGSKDFVVQVRGSVAATFQIYEAVLLVEW